MDDGVATKVRVTLRGSLTGQTETQRRTVWALGLRRRGATRVHTMTPVLRGALRKVEHLVEVSEVTDGQHR